MGTERINKMTIKYTEITGLIQDISSRQQAAETEENRLIIAIQQNEAAYDLKEIAGEDTKELSGEISRLQGELKQAQRKSRAFQKKPNVIANFLKGDSNIAKLAKAIHDDNVVQIEGLQKDYDAKNVILQEIKAEYLSTVAAMGSQAQEAQELANEISNVKRYIPGKETTFFQGIPDPVSHQHSTSIYLSASEIENSYKKGVIK